MIPFSIFDLTRCASTIIGRPLNSFGIIMIKDVFETYLIPILNAIVLHIQDHTGHIGNNILSEDIMNFHLIIIDD